MTQRKPLGIGANSRGYTGFLPLAGPPLSDPWNGTLPRELFTGGHLIEPSEHAATLRPGDLAWSAAAGAFLLLEF